MVGVSSEQKVAHFRLKYTQPRRAGPLGTLPEQEKAKHGGLFVCSSSWFRGAEVSRPTPMQFAERRAVLAESRPEVFVLVLPPRPRNDQRSHRKGSNTTSPGPFRNPALPVWRHANPKGTELMQLPFLSDYPSCCCRRGARWLVKHKMFEHVSGLVFGCFWFWGGLPIGRDWL